MNRKTFFDGVRKAPFGSLKKGQVKGCDAILDAWEKSGLTDLRWLAYMFATTFHETGAKMQPIVENLNYSAAGLRRTFRKYFTEAQAKQYARKPEAIANRAYANRMDNGPESSGDGWKYRGRGYVQITGRANYTDMTRRVGENLVDNPDLALDPEVASFVMFEGMTKGTFTGKKLSDYLNDKRTDWRQARRIINAMDKADTIAKYGQQFHSALVAASEAAPDPEPPVPVPTPPQPDDPGSTPKEPAFWAFMTDLGALIARYLRRKPQA